MTKIVSQLDGAGYFVGPAIADQDSMDPEEYLLPFGCVDAEPPVIPEGKRARFVDGVFVLEDIPAPPQAPAAAPPTPQQIQASITAEVQARLDAFARQREYDGIISLCSYAGDPDATLKAEGTLGMTKRSQTWAKMKQIRAAVLAGTRPMPTSIADIEAELPALNWPAS